MANDNTKLQTETSASKARRSKLRIETEMGARKTAEVIGEKHVVVDSKLRKEREKKKLTPEDEKKNGIRNRYISSEPRNRPMKALFWQVV